MEHNRDEEIEHAIMTLEWIRRKNTKFDRNLRTYLFAEGPITEIEKSNPRQRSGGRTEKRDSRAERHRAESRGKTER